MIPVLVPVTYTGTGICTRTRIAGAKAAGYGGFRLESEPIENKIHH